ncbi:hypothetical protein CN514_12360 [Bacillus sp. AFS001701]|uniref:hypothetical protein n=1 Tax=Bacillus sp. AFS001701 TaxID=2033480 RepID=UPI000BF8B1CF|nr:hypothetical protein [Bacillus sp. AFS001701]PET65156.1 hypothetical protein CN514_12360 [Bacillus sp. AFS001701]
MTQKFTLKQVKQYVLEHSDCILISNEYIGIYEKLDFICGCGKPFQKSFFAFKYNKQYQCKSCGFARTRDSMSLNIEEIKRYVEKHTNCKLVSTEYKSNREKLDFICECGNPFQKSFEKFKGRNEILCKTCGRLKQMEARKLTFETVFKFVDENSNCVLISKEYKNAHTKLEFLCSCGKKFKKTFDKFMSRNQRQCKKCGYHNISIIKTLNFEDVKKFVEEHSDCILKSTEYIDYYSELEFECKCGKMFKTSYDNFKHTDRRRCITCTKIRSKGEFKIQSYLLKNNIKFEEEYRFPDCKYKNTLPFDFYLPDLNICIEFDGKQHFEEVFVNQDLKAQKKRDKVKTKYCKDNKIELIRIPYYEYKNINEILDGYLFNLFTLCNEND